VIEYLSLSMFGKAVAWVAWLTKNAIVLSTLHKQGNIPLTHRHIPLTWLLSIQEITMMPRWKSSLLGRRSPWSRSSIDVTRVSLPVFWWACGRALGSTLGCRQPARNRPRSQPSMCRSRSWKPEIARARWEHRGTQG